MCGRFTLHHAPKDVNERFAVQDTLFAIAPRYNIAPSQTVAAVVQSSGRRLEGFKWGLVPFWAKDPKIGNRMINARAETLLEKPAFKYAFAKRRCIIPADGFYEWEAKGKVKQPLYLRMRDGRLFGLAGLWEEWKSPDGSTLRTCTIITVEPNPLVASVHNRMAAILKPEAESAWLDGSIKNGADLLGLLQAFPEEEMELYKVSRKVNSPDYDAPDCIHAAETQALF